MKRKLEHQGERRRSCVHSFKFVLVLIVKHGINVSIANHGSNIAAIVVHLPLFTVVVTPFLMYIIVMLCRQYRTKGCLCKALINISPAGHLQQVRIVALRH